ncbi:MarR family winged helix-turn-helix transcriptional regulator [Breznakiella homolactica]|uniref:Winged helix-turn-helix transcriptional regulator n=1 Tax=Breznakiella homolactica TaxID=2798577 RepID=A0A7T7XJY9_9SPIR|nr:MarR family winged helix-turn-helix transcriptional regulator [Breznakiella homolactica]QQO07799.1 MarR family winged helix-turn-helix transcriptional regulator [Breznakiella homolactica]
MGKEIDIGRQVSGISNKIRHRFDAMFAGRGITGTQASILHFINMEGKKRDVFPRDIEAEFYIRRSSVTSVLDGLEERGFIRRENVAADGRLKKLVLTDKARKMSKQVASLISKIDSTMLNGISKEDIISLDRLLTRIGDNLS